MQKQPARSLFAAICLVVSTTVGVWGADLPDNFAPGYPRVFLLSNILNGRHETASSYMEEIVSEGGNGTRQFSIPSFAYRNDDSHYAVRVRFGAGANDYRDFESNEFDALITRDQMFMQQLFKNKSQGGWGARALFTLTGTGTGATGQLQILPRDPAHPISDDFFPYIGLVSGDFHQEQTYNTARGNTDMGWEEAYIEYDAEGYPVLINDQAQYNTIWPPRRDIPMVAQSDHGHVNISSTSLTLSPERDANGAIVVKNGKAWAQELGGDPNYHNLFEFEGEHLDDADEFIPLHKDNMYSHYVAHNVWLNGKFRIWTGWGGNLKDDGTADWSNFFWWGPTGTAVRDVQPNTVYGALTGPSFNVSSPQYFETIEFFIPMQKPKLDGGAEADNYVPITVTGSIGTWPNTTQWVSCHGRLLLIKGAPYAQLEAAKSAHDNHEVYGLYLPSIDDANLDGYKVKSYRIVRADYTEGYGGTDKARFVPVDPDYHKCTEQVATVAQWEAAEPEAWLATNAQLQATIQSERENDMWVDARLAPGKYFYYMEITFAKPDVQDVTKIILSPYVDILPVRCETMVRLAQLVKRTNGNSDAVADRSYVIYNPNVSQQYEVILTTDGKVQKVGPLLTDQYLDYALGYFTDKILAETIVPAQFKNPGPTSREITDLTIHREYTRQGTTLTDDADFTMKANADITVRPGISYYAVFTNRDSWEGQPAPALDLERLAAEFYATFAATLTTNNGIQHMGTTNPDADTYYWTRWSLPLTFPAWSVESLEANVTAYAAPVSEVSYADADGNIRTAQNVAENRLDVTLHLNEPRIYPQGLAEAVAAETQGYTLDMHAAGTADRASQTSFTPAATLTVQGVNPVGLVDLSQNGSARLSASVSSQFAHPEHLRTFTQTGVDGAECTLTSSGYAEKLLNNPYMFQTWQSDGLNNRNIQQLYMMNTHIPAVDDRLGDTPLSSYSEGLLYSIDSQTEQRAMQVAAPFTVAMASRADQGTLIGEWGPYTWYDDMQKDLTIPSDLTVTLTAQHLFRLGGDTDTPRAARALNATADNTVTHAALPGTVYTIRNATILTDLDEVATPTDYFTAGADYIDIHASGVSVYTPTGLLVTSAEGRHTLTPGVYIVATPTGTTHLIMH